MPPLEIYIGCAGWAIPKGTSGEFPSAGTHLERYARRFPAVEINSSFYRAHRPETYARWAASTPEAFRFAVKVPRPVTHLSRLADPGLLGDFRIQTASLGEKLGVWLVQLPPSLAFDARKVEVFFSAVRRIFDGNVACEPRHPSWFTPDVDNLFSEYRVARVAADPTLSTRAAAPGGWHELVYYRLHGSPQVYHSSYSLEYLEALAQHLLEAAHRPAQVWCIFDNTAEGAAVANALAVLNKLQSSE